MTSGPMRSSASSALTTTEPTLPTFSHRPNRHARRTHRPTRRSIFNRYADAILFLWSCLLIASLIILALT
jgi:hypothetical protein